MNEIVNPRLTWVEKFTKELVEASPQVKAALIGVFGSFLLTAAGGIITYIITTSENSRLRSKVHDLENDLMPFKILTVQQLGTATEENMKKVAALMRTYVATLNSNRLEIDRLSDENEKAAKKWYSLRREEHFSTMDTNYVSVLNFTNGAKQVFFRLRPS